jgi:iron complex outermembrane receptor protein
MPKWSWLLVVLAFFSFVAPCAVEAEQANKDAEELEEIVVTATKTEKSVQEAPASVTVVTWEEMTLRNLETVDDALNDIVGLFVKRSKGLMDATTSVRMRGFNGDKYTLVLLDGQPLNSAYTGDVEWGALPTDNIERIEVIRGPASALYGGNAMGGVINIITKTPKKKELKAAAGFGSHNIRRYAFSAGDRLGDTLGLRLGYEEESTDGYANTPVFGSSVSAVGGYEMNDPYGSPRWVVGDKGENGARRRSLDAKADYAFSETGKLTFSVLSALHAYDYGPPSTYTGTFNETDNYEDNAFISYTGMGENCSETYALSGEETLCKIKVNLQAGTIRGTDQYTLESGNGTQGYNDSPGKLSVTDQESWFSEVRGSTVFGDAHLLTLGVSFRTDESDTNEYNVPFYRSYAGRGPSTYNAAGKDRFWGVFAQEEWQAADTLTLYLGLRYDMWEVYDGSSGPPGAETVYDDNRDTALNPRVAAVWQAADTTTLRASVGRAFRPPNLYELYRSWTSYSTDYVANPELEPETVWSYEVGIDQALFGKRTRLSLNSYRNDIDDLIYYRTERVDGRTVKTRVNAGKARTYGLELTLSQTVTDWLNLWGNYTYTDARILDNATDPDSEDKQVAGIPEQTWNIGLDTTFGPITAGVVYRYFSKIYNDSDNEDTEDGVYGSYEPSHIMDAKLTWNMAAWAKVSLCVDNVWDKEYYQYYQTDGRTWFAELTLSY